MPCKPLLLSSNLESIQSSPNTQNDLGQINELAHTCSYGTCCNKVSINHLLLTGNSDYVNLGLFLVKKSNKLQTFYKPLALSDFDMPRG